MHILLRIAHSSQKSICTICIIISSSSRRIFFVFFLALIQILIPAVDRPPLLSSRSKICPDPPVPPPLTFLGLVFYSHIKIHLDPHVLVHCAPQDLLHACRQASILKSKLQKCFSIMLRPVTWPPHFDFWQAPPGRTKMFGRISGQPRILLHPSSCSIL